MTEFDEEESVTLPLNLNQGVEVGLELGQQAAYNGQEFCPILAVSKFPYKFVKRSHSDRVAKLFFDTGKFWKNEWELYYIWPPQDLSDKPLILIRSDQFLELISEINKVVKGLNFSITDNHYEDSLVLQIPHPSLSPRYLGQSNSRDDYDNMERNVPGRGRRAKDEKTLEAPPLRTLQAFKDKIEAAIELNKNKASAAKARKKEARLVTQQEWRRQLKRSQRYLGLRPKTAEAANRIPDCIPAINSNEAAPYIFDSSVVFVCVDIEAYERAHNKITEIGFAILDVNDLKGIAPGDRGQNWFSKIRARHFRISEHSHLHNSEFVAGCADRFEFGKSEFISLMDVRATVASCFKKPFCGPKEDLVMADAESGGVTLNASQKRNVVFVGHDANQDINYLQTLGYNPLNLSNLLEILDTALIHRSWKHDTNSRSLGQCLYDLDLVGWNLHNAGNDAVYTMQVLIAISVSQATTRGTWMEKQKRDEENQKQLNEAVMEAMVSTHEKQEGWGDTDDGDDGGDPVAVKKPATNLKANTTEGKLGKEDQYRSMADTLRRAGLKPNMDPVRLEPLTEAQGGDEDVKVTMRVKNKSANSKDGKKLGGGGSAGAAGAAPTAGQ
ncbi:hypothetical protein K490DRAFT_33126 [Saccharata proteae CBS 121410]|uniref:Gfd2/YDR514C-like C-terminal domain-containing protein n=1 Tax=Saccharata proteae CBS 121410 TaxID=1314787 RepID=A0A9P4I240_9PEZI|nr:hypothetical protein K490DRAFT_33126 [Saccharata proteae CBS 121410]